MIDKITDRAESRRFQLTKQNFVKSTDRIYVVVVEVRVADNPHSLFTAEWPDDTSRC